MLGLVVQRFAGEITADPVREFLRDTDLNVVRVSGAPFEVTLSNALMVSADSSEEWSLHLDGDVVPGSGMLESLNESIDFFARKGGVGHIHAPAIDRLSGTVARRGVRIYRRGFARACLSLLPPPTKLERPETYAVRTAATGSERWRLGRDPKPVALHGWWQSPLSMARASFLAARKHSGLDVQRLKEWASSADEEPDFKYALVGFAAALTHQNVNPLDAQSVEETIAEFAESIGMEVPKSGQLNMDYRSLVEIAQKRLDALPPPEHRRFIEYVPRGDSGRHRLIPTGALNILRAYGAGHIPTHLLDALVRSRAARERRAIW